MKTEKQKRGGEILNTDLKAYIKSNRGATNEKSIEEIKEDFKNMLRQQNKITMKTNIKEEQTDSLEDVKETPLLKSQAALEAVFPDERSRPSPRAWAEWRARGYYPYVKIGTRVWINPDKARKALVERFTVEAKQPKENS